MTIRDTNKLGKISEFSLLHQSILNFNETFGDLTISTKFKFVMMSMKDIDDVFYDFLDVGLADIFDDVLYDVLDDS